MKILVVSQYYYPEQFRVNEICEELVKRGHAVTVVTGLPNYPDGEIFPGYEHAHLKHEIINGVKIIRCNNRPRHKGTINLIRNYISYAHKASKTIMKIDEVFDVVYVYEISPITMGIPAIRYKKKRKIPVYLYCLDIWPECVRDRADNTPMSVRNPIYKFAKAISKHIYNKVDLIGVKCKQFGKYLCEICKVDEKKIVELYEHAESSYLAIPDEAVENDVYDFMFLGNIGSSQNCISLVRAFQKIDSNDKCKLHFVGSGSEVENLRKYVIENDLDEKVIFHGSHPLSEINDYYCLADCCLLSLSCKTAVGLTPPAKLSGYMAASRPVLAAASGATVDIINDSGCGFCVDPDKEDSLSELMGFAILHQEKMKDMGKNGRKYFLSHFTLEKHIEALEEQLKALIS